MSALLVVLVVLPLAGALAGVAIDGPGSDRMGRVGTAAAGLGFAAAVALLVAVAADGPVSAVLERSDGRAVAGLYVDRLAVVLLVLVCGVSAVVQAFARRYLHGDVRGHRFFIATGWLTTATAAMVAAATLIGLAVAWTVAGVALLALLDLYRGHPGAREGVRRTVRAFAVADVALWIAVAVALVAWGDLDLRRLADQAPALVQDATALALVACGLVVAALGRSAQLPLQGWLPATLAAPTPVSALLHAGVVNAGGILLVRLSPLFGASALATHLAFAAGALTVVYGTTLMAVKPDVKGALAHSTMGQMGFMVMTCGLGAFAAAIFHLVAHGMYKATLFLGSGGAVSRHVRRAKAPPADEMAARPGTTAFVAVAVAVVSVGGAALALRSPVDGAQGTGALLLFAAASVGWAAHGWLRRHPTPLGAAAALATAVVAAAAYVGLLHATTSFLAPALRGAGTATTSPWLLVPVLAILGLGTVLRLGATGRGGSDLAKALYVLALDAGHVRRASRHGARRPLALAVRANRPLIPCPEEVQPCPS